MSEAAEVLLKKALSLDEKDRASIAGALIESLHGVPETGVEEAWEAEIKRRVGELGRALCGDGPMVCSASPPLPWLRIMSLNGNCLFPTSFPFALIYRLVPRVEVVAVAH